MKDRAAYTWGGLHLSRHQANSFARGTAYAAMGQHDRAVRDFDQAIGLKPDVAGVFLVRGSVYATLGQHDRAIADYSQAIKLKPNDAIGFRAFRSRGETYATVGQHDRAIADYSQAIKLKPDDALVLEKRGLTYLAMGQHDRAIRDFDHVTKINPDSAAALWLHLADKRHGEDYDAREFIRQVARIDPNQWPAPIARLYLGQETLGQVLAAATSADAQTGKGNPSRIAT